jgi:hypothetical protein
MVGFVEHILNVPKADQHLELQENEEKDGAVGILL